jgi:cyclic pyranopterin phosphate synthase
VPDKPLSHLDAEGRARMVDVSAKPATVRTAVAAGRVRMTPETLARIESGDVAKGDVLAVARIAGIQGAKRTADLVPLCHPLRLDHVAVTLEPAPPDAIEIRVEARALERTGVEMEALTATCAAALALYDMIKGIDRAARIEDVRLLSKEGGKSGLWKATEG